MHVPIQNNLLITSKYQRVWLCRHKTNVKQSDEYDFITSIYYVYKVMKISVRIWYKIKNVSLVRIRQFFLWEVTHCEQWDFCLQNREGGVKMHGMIWYEIVNGGQVKRMGCG